MNDYWIDQYNAILTSQEPLCEAISSLEVVRQPEMTDPESVEVAITYNNGLVRYIVVESYDRLQRFLTARPFDYYSVGTPLVFAHQVTPETIRAAVWAYLSQEEGLAECGRNSEVYRLYGARITAQPDAN